MSTTTSNSHAPRQTRKVPLEVLHLSMPRTGSVSMMAAYQRLGLTTYHGFDFIERESDQVEWEKAIDAKWYGKGTPFKREDFDAFLGEFGVISDFPAIGFSEEFIEMYPEAKVILVDRDIDKWFHSFSTHIISAVYTRTVQFMLHYVEPFIKTRTVTTMLKMEQGMFKFKNRTEFENNARDTYRKHYANVRRLVPKERLLEYKLGSGWEPLCEFLGKEVPDEEFPFKNESKEMEVWMKNFQRRKMLEELRILGSSYIWIPVMVGLGAWMMRKMMRKLM